jgi:predicted Zn finger-like uncharacterized protein
MIIECQGCTAKYYLANEKVPPKPVKVRCPKCKAVFRLEPPSPMENPVAQEAKKVVSSDGAARMEAHPVEAAPVGTATEPTPRRKGRSRKVTKEERAKRLARVLVSDILCYNREKRDQALIDGNLMAVLGEEIKKSWELYKEKVGSDLADSTDFFKEALNEILADGQKIF